MGTEDHVTWMLVGATARGSIFNGLPFGTEKHKIVVHIVSMKYKRFSYIIQTANKKKFPQIFLTVVPLLWHLQT